MTYPSYSSGTSGVSSGVWVDNMSLEQLNATRALNPPTTATVDSSGNQKFWSTPARPVDSETVEVMQLTLGAERVFNYMRFDVAHFPQDVWVEYFDTDTRTWQPCLDGRQPRPTPVLETILDSSPGILPPPTSIGGDLHPQHSFSGHWQTLEWRLRPTTTQDLRILLRRNNTGSPPATTFGAAADYSLAIRSLYLGYQVRSRSDVPLTKQRPGNYTEYQSFASTQDLFGSAVSYSIRVNKAENILHPIPLPEQTASVYSAETSTPQNVLVWRSQPQPFPWAVVNFYADVRGQDGGPQVLDRFFLDPTVNGPNCNLYYSNDEPDTEFVAGTDMLPYPVATIHDAGGIGGNVLHSGPRGTGKIAFVDIDNSGLGFRASQSWWIGASLNVKTGHGTQTEPIPILDCGVVNIALTELGLQLATSDGDRLVLPLDPFSPNDEMTFVASHDHTTGVITMRAKVAHLNYYGQLELSLPLTHAIVPTLRFGGFLTETVQVGDFDLRCLTWKIDTLPTDEVIDSFFINPDPFARRPDYAADDDHRTNNALLRYHFLLSDEDFPAGFVGGSPDRYAEMTWSPIARDYTLRRGFLQFPPTKAKYWKLEFSGLKPAPHEVYKPISRKVHTYTMDMWSDRNQPYGHNDLLHQMLPGVLESMRNNTLGVFAWGRVARIGVNTTISPRGTSNTMVRIIWDANNLAHGSAAYWAWNFLPLHHDPNMTPMFQTVIKHNYEEVEVEHRTKLAYFVGLKSIAAYRLDYLSLEDTGRYLELFQDEAHLDEGNMTLAEDGRLSSGSAFYSEMVSSIFPSQRAVRAIQFATTQSGPRQLLPDDDFTDETHDAWLEVGDGTLAPTITTDDKIGTMLRVDRSLTQSTWDYVTQSFATWTSFGDRDANFATVSYVDSLGLEYGGISSDTVAAPSGGRLHAAARVVAPRALRHPLWVEIVELDSGRVLSRSSVNVPTEEITEWYTSYTVGDGRDIVPWRWTDFFSRRDYQKLIDTFDRDNATTLGSFPTDLAPATMASQQEWHNGWQGIEPVSLEIQNNEAVAIEPGAYNWVDSGTPWGSLEITLGDLIPPATTSKMATLIDGFAGTALDTVTWNASTPNITVSGGQATMPVTTPTTNPSIIGTSRDYDFTDSSISVELVSAPVASSVSRWVGLDVQFPPHGDANRFSIWVERSSLYFRTTSGGTVTDQTSIPYVAASHRWLRLRESGDRVYFETSAEGVSWTVRHSTNHNLTPQGLAACRPMINTASHFAEPSAVAIIDNVNLTPPKTAALTDAFTGASISTTRWNNNAGTITVSGGRARISAIQGFSYLRTSTKHDFKSSSWAFEMVQAPATAGTGIGVYADLVFDNGLITTGIENGRLVTWINLGGQAIFGPTVAFDAARHRWWRFSEVAGIAYWWTSPDGVTWALLWSQTHGFTDAKLATARPQITTGYHNTATTTTEVAVVDNINLAPEKLATLVDTFHQAALDTARWDSITGTPTVENGQLSLPCVADANHNWTTLSTARPWDAGASSLSAKMVSVPASASNDRSTSLRIYLPDTNSQFAIIVESGNIIYRCVLDGVLTDVAVPFDPAVHVWWRLREAEGSVYWDTSVDGQTWAVRRTSPHGLSSATLARAWPILECGSFTAGSTAAIVDNVNAPPGTPDPPDPTPSGGTAPAVPPVIPPRGLVEFAPLHITTQGELYYNDDDTLRTGSVVASGTETIHDLVAGDRLRVEIMPTTFVPADKTDPDFANPDPVTRPYSLLVYLNDTWTTTIAHTRGASTYLALHGEQGRRFRSFTWRPFDYGALPGPVINHYPHDATSDADVYRNGFFRSAQRYAFLDNWDNEWFLDGDWDTSAEVLIPGWRPPLIARSPSAACYVDTRYWYGTLGAHVSTVAGSASGGGHGNILCLDYANRIFLNADGDIVNVDGLVLTNLIPGGITDDTDVEVAFLRTADVAASRRGMIDPTLYPRMLLATVDGVEVGTYAANTLSTTWTGTLRGLAGDVYDPETGSRPAGPAHELDTTFSGFWWAPDTSTTVADPQTPSWAEVTRFGTETYESTTLDRIGPHTEVAARVVQYGESHDVFYVDALSLYADPIVWSFSRDGGYTFYPAYGIANNPHGVLLFPDSTTAISPGQRPGTALVWKATCYWPHTEINSLVIRPWYGGMASGRTHRVGLSASGPNRMPYDHYSDITDDPHFRNWRSPIPQDWWFFFRALARAHAPRPAEEIPPSPTAPLMLPSNLISEDTEED